MPKKLKSVLKNLVSQLSNKAIRKLFLKVGLCVLLLLWINQSRSFLAIVIFLASSLYFYLSSRFLKNSEISVSFLFVFLSSFIESFYGLSLFYFPIFGIFYFLVLGLKGGIFKNNRVIYQILNNFLLFAAFIIFFFPGQSQWFFWKFIGFAALIFFLMREFLKTKLLAAVFSFLTVQLAWATMFLPIGFLNSSALMLVIVLIFKNFITAYLSKSLNNVLIMKNITILAIFGLVIFMASRWQP
ncbi:hypothetical protein HZB04_00640 [Candidatus Wolfebacteria bacterium]|nr:hypothetical protein [Candidatus Wolfebacteria bacterium]